MSSPDQVRKLTYTPGEVAAMIGTSEWWVREQIRRRRVPHVRLGQRRMALREQDIPALLEIFAVDVVPEAEDTTTPEGKVQQLSDLAVIGLSDRSLARHQRARKVHTPFDTPPSTGKRDRAVSHDSPGQEPLFR
jgi:hypothetical protein